MTFAPTSKIGAMRIPRVVRAIVTRKMLLNSAAS